MRILYFFLIFSLIFPACRKPLKVSDPGALATLDQWVAQQDYFKLHAGLENLKPKLSNAHILYYQAMLDQVFNRPKASNQQIASLIENSKVPLKDSLMKHLYEMKLQNHIYLQEYAQAAETNALLVKEYASLLDSSELDDLENTWKIWHALEAVPAQEFTRNQDVTIPMKKDKVGLFNIQVGIGGRTMDMIFDTGANLSVIRRSYVDSLGLQLIPAGFEVGALTGARIKSDLAVAENLQIGGLTFKHVVFLVFDDADLSIPQVDYHMNGIIGFPVIEAMEEIRIRKDNTLFIPREVRPYTDNNLALDGLTPLVAVAYSGDTLNFHLDTGAPTTALFAPFFRKYEQEIRQGREKTEFKTGGAGGIVNFEGYILDSLRLKIGSSAARLDSIQVHMEDIGAEEGYFHGNLGQDYIKQFQEMVLSFKYASIRFNNPDEHEIEE